jgi:endonuclease III
MAEWHQRAGRAQGARPSTASSDIQSRFELSRPLDLVATLAPIGRGASLRLEGNEVWRATQTPQGPATIHLVIDGTTAGRAQGALPAVIVSAWGPGAAWAVANAPALCGEEDDPASFKPQHPLLARVHRTNPGLRIPRSLAVFEALLPAVIGQKVTSMEAHQSYGALVSTLGERAPGPVAMTVPPPAAVLAKTPYWAFHRFGIEWRRAEVIINAARSAKKLEETITMDMPGAHARLEAFPGVGPWTAAKVALVALGDADAVPVGDYHLPDSVGYALEGTARSTDERMLELLEPYRPHRGRVVRLIGLAGIVAPRFGPRMPLRNIARD